MPANSEGAIFKQKSKSVDAASVVTPCSFNHLPSMGPQRKRFEYSSRRPRMIRTIDAAACSQGLGRFSLAWKHPYPKVSAGLPIRQCRELHFVECVKLPADTPLLGRWLLIASTFPLALGKKPHAFPTKVAFWLSSSSSRSGRGLGPIQTRKGSEPSALLAPHVTSAFCSERASEPRRLFPARRIRAPRVCDPTFWASCRRGGRRVNGLFSFAWGISKVPIR